MNTEHPRPLNRQILDEASEWLVELNTGDADQAARQRFDAWLRASPEHMRAYLELLPLWEEAATPPASADPGPEVLIAWARRADNVVPMGETADTSRLTPGQSRGDRAPVATLSPSFAHPPLGRRLAEFRV